MTGYSIRYTSSGMIFLGPEDDCDTVVDIMLSTDYSEEFCLAVDWNTDFVIRLMKAGFLVMSGQLNYDDENGNRVFQTILLPKLHLERSVLRFEDLHVKKSVKRFLGRYRLVFDPDFNGIVRKCVRTWGSGWLTPGLVKTLFAIREIQGSPVRPVSFGLYRDGNLVAGEFGVVCGRVYTSYSGWHDESNAGTVQMILMIRWLQENGFAFLDFGMPLDYKSELGAVNVSPAEFVRLYRAAAA